MNVRRIDKLIEALETDAAKKMFDMGNWIKRILGKSGRSKSISQSLQSGGGCGTSGCMLGMAAAVAPRYFSVIFEEGGEGLDNYYEIACKHDKDITESEAFAEWLEIPREHAAAFCDPSSEWWFRKSVTNIKHAIKLLKTYRDKGPEALPSLDW